MPLQSNRNDMLRIFISFIVCAYQSQAIDFFPTQQNAFIASTSELQLLWSDAIFTEGPAVAPDGSIYFSAIRTARIMRYDPVTAEISTYRNDSGKSNGLMFDREGLLIACEGADYGGRRVSMTKKDGSIISLAERFEGKRFNSPNDLSILPNGRIYFTDPRYRGHEPREIDVEGIYFIDTDGTVKLATDEIDKPNGILISIDTKTAFLACFESIQTKKRQLVKFSIRSDGSFGDKEVLFDFGDRRGADGMAIDTEGNIYAAAGVGKDAGIYIFSPTGEHLALLSMSKIGAVTNCQFGIGEDASTLYITAAVEGKKRGRMGAFGLYKIKLKKKGYHPATAQ